MAEYGYNSDQNLAPGQMAILEDIRPCNRCPQLVVHDNMTPNLGLRGIVRNMSCCNPKATYSVSFEGNIAVAEGGAAGEIQLALYVDGFIRPFTISASTPTVAGSFFHAGGNTDIDVPAGCCVQVAVGNASVSATAGGVAPTVTVRNLNVKVKRTA